MVIKTLNKVNPFADYGNIVTKPHFVGRDKEISIIENRVLNSNYGNIAIIGLPRIGKSSLAWNSLIEKKNSYKDNKIVFVWLNVGTFSNKDEFYKKLLNKVIFELLKFDKSLYDNLLNIDDTELFFALIKQFQYRVIVILDEFDNASNILELADFQLLRELSISPETKICLVTISRKTIQEIEPENGAISNFYGVFTELRLGLFNENDVSQYWQMVSSFDIEISDDYKKTVKYFVGNHPFLMDLFNFEVYNYLKENPSKKYTEIINEIEGRLRLNLINNFESILNLLRKEGLYNKAVQIVLGPLYDVKVLDEQRLLKYEFLKLIDTDIKNRLIRRNGGLIKDNKSYVCFSDYFTEMMYLNVADIEYWPLWGKTEKYVRTLIKEYLNKKFGENWVIGYMEQHKNSKGKIEGIKKLNDVMKSSHKKFGNLASKHLVDYTFPRDMYDLFISADWKWFEKILGDSKKEWGKRFNTLSDIRNPIAHNNSEFISDEQRNMAINICNLIIKRIEEYNNKV
ncbi:hypothetical protein [Lutibacter sp.]